MSALPCEPSLPEAVRVQYPMMHDETQVLNIEEGTLYGLRQTRREFGIAVPTIAKIQAAKHIFSVLDTRSSDVFNSPLLVVDGSFNDNSPPKGYKGIWEAEPVVLGRDHHVDRFNCDSTVSGSHFSLAFDGLSLVVNNLRPMNKTLLSADFVSGPTNRQRQGNIVATFTDLAYDDIKHRSGMGPKDAEAPHGYYNNHPRLGRKSTTIKNGVYFTTRPDSEAVVVDDKSKTMLEIKAGMLTLVRRKFGENLTMYEGYQESVLKLINKYTKKVLPYSDRKSNRLSEPHYSGNTLINLSEYIKIGGGVCRHQCLVAAFLAEALVDNNLLTGYAGVQRNYDIDAHGAHAWATFTSPSGSLYVIDPAQNFVGTKEQAHKERRWKYDMPEQI